MAFEKEKMTTIIVSDKQKKRTSAAVKEKPLLTRISPDEIELIECIGSGSFGQVYKAKYKGDLVAVKFGNGDKKNFAAELEALSSVDHPNIVKLYGASAGTRFFLVMELGVTNLCDYYKTHEYSYKHLFSWTSQIAEGMRELHSHKIVHRDLKTANVLLDGALHVKICDFGTSRDFNMTTMMTFTGTISYMAPELLKEMPVSEKIDIYSFAVLLWELITKQVPFASWKPVQIIWFIAGEGRRLPIPEDCPDIFRNIIERCWAEEPKKRPDFNEILSTLMKVVLEESTPQETESLLETQQRWNLTLPQKVHEFKELGILKELDQMKKKEEEFREKNEELKEREENLKKKEQEVEKELERLNLDKKSDAAKLLRRIKTLPSNARASKNIQKLELGPLKLPPEEPSSPKTPRSSDLSPRQ